jgi:hypothetical protein
MSPKIYAYSVVPRMFPQKPVWPSSREHLHSVPIVAFSVKAESYLVVLKLSQHQLVLSDGSHSYGPSYMPSLTPFLSLISSTYFCVGYAL